MTTKYTDLRTAFDFDDHVLVAIASDHDGSVLFTDANFDPDDHFSLTRLLLPTGFNDPDSYADHGCDYCDQPLDTANDPLVLHDDGHGPADLAHLACFQRSVRS